MAKYRKLSRTSSQRKALLRGQVTALLNNGKIVTTEAKAKEVRKIAEGLIAMAVREKDNFEEVTVKEFETAIDVTEDTMQYAVMERRVLPIPDSMKDSTKRYLKANSHIRLSQTY